MTEDVRQAEAAAVAAGKYFQPEHGGEIYPNADFVAGYLAACARSAKLAAALKDLAHLHGQVPGIDQYVTRVIEGGK